MSTANPRSRAQIARSAADAVDRYWSSNAEATPALIGFDGFIDSIIDVVDQRHSMATEDYRRIAEIPSFAARAGSAAGKSANVELVVKEQRFGGNGPLMAGAMGRLGAPVTYIGAVGASDTGLDVDPVFRPFAERCRRVIPVGCPAFTDALEFDDGKLMLGKTQNVQLVTWERVKFRVGEDELFRLVNNASILGVVNWVMLGGVEGIWRGLIDEMLGRLDRSRRRRIFIDLCDPAKRTDADVSRALGLIRELNGFVPVTLGLNLSESVRIARVCGAAPFDESHNATMGVAVRETTESIREALGLDTVVVHPRQGAAAANASGDSAWFDGPYTSRPALSTGAGDHFNGGFAFAQAAGLGLPECLAVGCATSGAYVRDALSPDRARLCAFLSDLPDPQ
jgi:sugar/nucleoside kinase (ribokinase family)